MSPSVYFALFYFLFALVFIFPPTEFQSAGLTIECIFQNLLGSENEMFIQYHIKRSSLNILLQSLLPLGYVAGHQYFTSNHDSFGAPFEWSAPWQCFALITCLIPAVVGAVVWSWSWSYFANHPIARKLAVYTNTTWHAVASDINIEFRRVDKISIQTSSVTRVVATDNWVIKISPYTVDFAFQSDSALILSSADVHQWSPYVNDGVQFVNIEVKPTRRGSTPFKIRLNALDLKDLQNRVSRPITILDNVRVRRSLTERFLDTFTEEVGRNPVFETQEELESCIGCMQVTANVKLRKMCEDDATHREHCTNCYCKPMWCVDCMGRWFASRQDKEPSTWLSSKCSCPLCRASFCILDVCPVVSIP